MAVLEALLTTYGLLSILAVIVIASVVWLISHFATKPGGKVSVLWGLTTYERRDSSKIKPTEKEGASELKIIDSLKSFPSRTLAEPDKHVLVANIEDSLLIDTETQRSSNDLVVHHRGNQLTQLAIVSLTVELHGESVMPTVNLHLKRKRPGQILSALPQILGDVEFQYSAAITPLGIQISFHNMHPKERFRLQMLTDGLRATDFHLVQEPRTSTIELKVEKSEDWQP